MTAEYVKKRLEVTFKDGLPMGTRGEFTHDGEPWVAYPREKNRRILTVIDRLVGIHSAILDDMVRWINQRPQDSEIVTRVLERVGRARKVHEEIIVEKARAATL